MQGYVCFTAKHNAGIARELRSTVRIINPVITRLAEDDGKEEPDTAARYNAIWDTGATNTVITKEVAGALTLKPIDVAKVYNAHGSTEANVYLIDLLLPNEVVVKDLLVTEGVLHDVDVLVGMDVISIGDFTVSNFNGTTMFSFRTPSVEATDYVAMFKEQNKISISRNALCTCGSGKKYKRCCGQ